MLHSGSRKTYTTALTVFLEFLQTLPEYKTSAPIKTFLDTVADDMDLPRRERKRIDRKVLRGFVDFLQGKGLLPKSVRTYLIAVQSLGSYFEIPLSTRYLNLPKPHVMTKSHPWLSEELSEFIKILGHPLYQSLCAVFAQSGLSLVDALDIRYIDIKEEFEKGVTPLLLDFTVRGRHKTEVEFRTFISSEAIELLRCYFAISPPKPDMPIFPVSDRAVQDFFARRAKEMLGDWKYRNPMSPHTLRKFFRKSMVNAGCPPEYAEYMMGHDLETDLRKIYTSMTHEEWRTQYSKFAPALSFKLPGKERK